MYWHVACKKSLLTSQRGTQASFYTLPQWSARPLKGQAVGISHNAFSHRETSSQHEQGRNVARVWERPSGWREEVTDQRAWSRKGRKEGVCTEGSRVSLKQMEFMFPVEPQMRESYCREKHGVLNLHISVACMHLH